MAVWITQAVRPAATEPRSGAGGRTMAITFDDLPKANGFDDVDGARRTTDSDPACAQGAQGAGDRVRQRRQAVYRGATIVPDRVALLQSWVDAGIPLANHTYSHIDINDVPLEKYEDDVVRGREDLYEADARHRRHRAVVPASVHAHRADRRRSRPALDRFLAGTRLPDRAVHHREQRLDVFRRLRQGEEGGRRGARRPACATPISPTATRCSTGSRRWRRKTSAATFRRSC